MNVESPGKVLLGIVLKISWPKAFVPTSTNPTVISLGYYIWIGFVST